MSFFTTFLNGTKDFLNDNVSSIMTGVGIGAMGTSAVLAGTGAIKADRKIREAEVEPSKSEKFAIYGKNLAPAVVVGILGASLIVGSDILDMKEKAALGALYVSADQKLKSYKEKVKEKIGEKKEKDISHEVNAEKVKSMNLTTSGASGVVNTGHGQTLFVDSQFGTAFLSSFEHVRQSVNDFNEELVLRATKANHGLDVDTDVCANNNDFRTLLGLPEVDAGKFIGIQLCRDGQLRVDLTDIVELDDGSHAVLVDYEMFPIQDWRTWC